MGSRPSITLSLGRGTLAAFKAKEVVGCNYDIKPVAFEMLDEEGRFGFYFGEKGVGRCKLSGPEPLALMTPDSE